MIYNFDSLYRTETIEIKRDKNLLFTVIVQEVSQEASAKLQNEMFTGLDLDLEGSKNKVKSKVQSQISALLKSGKFSATEYAARQTLLGIRSWDLIVDGQAVPVCYEAFQALPKWVTSLIEKGVDLLNPELEDDFQE